MAPQVFNVHLIVLRIMKIILHASLFLFIYFYLTLSNSFAQDLEDSPQVSPADTSNWVISWRATLNGTQAAYNNWSSGGVSSMSAIGATAFSAKYLAKKNQLKSNINLRYGQTRVEDEGFRKSADEIRWRNQYLRKFQDERWGAIFNVNLETQFDEGVNKDTGELESDFFAPGYITEILGISYRPDDYFTAEAGISARQTIVRNAALSTRYGLDEGENFKNEFGFSFMISYEREIFPNIYYAGYLETFTNPEEDVFKSDFLFTNELTGQITDGISANFELSFRFNEDFIDEIQTKQLLSVGITYILR